MADTDQPKTDRPKQTYLIGRLTSDAKIIITKDGREVGKFAVAVNITNGTKDDPGETFFCDISLFDDKYIDEAFGAASEEGKRNGLILHQGDIMGVSGKMSFREYEGKQYAQMIANRVYGPLIPWERTPYQPREESAEFVAPF